MMKKRLSKTLWYGTDVDSYGNPIIPSFTADQHDLYGLHVGELFLHYSGGMATLWTANESGNVVKISGGEGGVDLSPYLLISEFNKIWELRTDSQGTEYIFGKLPVVTQYGITMYSGDNVDIPTIAEGLPFDNRTIWFNPTTGQIEVLDGTGGGSGEGVSNFWDLSGIPSWITNSKPKYTYSEIEGTPDLSKYALVSDIPSLSGYATEQWVLGRGFALSSDLSDYIPISGYTDILGEKNFVGGLKVNGSPIYYDKDKKYWKLEGDLLVTGGVTMYGNDSDFVPSTIMDAIVVDGTTISKEGGVLKVIGSVGGATTLGSISNVGSWADSVASQDRIMYQAANSSQWVAKNLSDLSVGGVTGDYLPLTGGELSGSLAVTAIQNGYWAGGIRIDGTTEKPPSLAFHIADLAGWRLYLDPSTQNLLWENSSNGQGVTQRVMLHSSNISSYALPLSGGTMTGTINTQFIRPSVNATYQCGTSSLRWDNVYSVYGNFSDSVTINGNTAWHSGNDGSGSGLDADLLDGKHYSDIINGNVASATKLQTSRTIWGQSFDGTGNVDGVLTINKATTSSGDYGACVLINGTYAETGFHRALSYENQKMALGSQAAVYIGAKNNQYNGGFIGFKYVASNSPSNYMAIGLYAANDLLCVLGNGNVGIGTTSPTYKLHVEGNIYSQNTFLTHSGYYIASSSTYERGRLFADQSTDSVWLQAGNWDGNTLNGTLVLSGINGRDLSLCKIVGSVLATGGITMYSDQRKKTILNHVELSLQQVANAPLIEHYYNSDEKRTTHVGSIAQYWAEMNDWFCKKDSDGYYTMEIQNAALASAISIARELVKFETETDRRIRLLEAENKRLKEEFEQLKWNIA